MKTKKTSIISVKTPDVARDIERHIVFSSDYKTHLFSIIDYLANRFFSETAFIVFYDSKSKKITNISHRGKELSKKVFANIETLAAKALTASKTFLVNKPDKEMRAILVTPVAIKEGNIAAIGVANPKTKDAFNAEDKKLIEATAANLIKDISYVKAQYDYRGQFERLQTLYNISQAVRETLDINKLLRSIMCTAKDILDSEASSLAIIDEKTNELIFTVAEGEKCNIMKEIRLKMGKGIIGWVAQNGKPLLIPNVSEDKRFFKGADEKTGFTTKSILCVPLIMKNNIIGAVEVLNKKDGSSFNNSDLDLLSALSGEAAVAIENARLFNLATTDGLTGVFTIRYFRTLLDLEYSRCLRYKRPLSLILSDIDHFKNVNDTYGHQIGDLILKETASLLKSNCRDVDIVGRYGGEEFIVMLPETSRDQAAILANRLRKKVEGHIVRDVNRKEHRVTISMGVSSLTTGESQDKLIKLADTALYKAKETGRNRVCCS